MKLEKHKLEEHRLYMKELLINLSRTIKDARAAYFSDLTVSNQHNPSVYYYQPACNSISSCYSCLLSC